MSENERRIRCILTEEHIKMVSERISRGDVGRPGWPLYWCDLGYMLVEYLKWLRGVRCTP